MCFNVQLVHLGVKIQLREHNYHSRPYMHRMNWNHDLKQYQQLQAHCSMIMGNRDTAVTYTLATVWTDKEKIAHMHDGILFYEKGQWIFLKQKPTFIRNVWCSFFFLSNEMQPSFKKPSQTILGTILREQWIN